MIAFPIIVMTMHVSVDELRPEEVIAAFALLQRPKPPTPEAMLQVMRRPLAKPLDLQQFAPDVQRRYLELMQLQKGARNPEEKAV